MTAQPLRVWLVDDDTSIRWVLERALKNGGMLPKAFDAAEPALAALRNDAPDVLITDIRMSGQSGLDLLRRVHDAHPELPVIVMTAYSDLGSAVSAYESGAFEYLAKPFDIDQAIDLVKRAAAAGVRSDREPRRRRRRIPELLGRAPAMQQVFRAIGRLSRSSVNVLITGESGTGKELAARALHEHSPRANKPFIALNTSAIPAELLESELFGHEKGAFTGADSLRRGRFEQADGGSLFLDEIGDMSTSLQTRLLRVLAEGEFYRVGGQTPIRVDVRVIAATHQNLEERVRIGPVPRGSVPSSERDPHRAAAAARAARGRAGSARALPARRGTGARRRAQDAARTKRARSSAPMPGPATCASWSICAAASRCSRRATKSAREDLPPEITGAVVERTGRAGLDLGARALGRSAVAVAAAAAAR